MQYVLIALWFLICASAFAQTTASGSFSLGYSGGGCPAADFTPGGADLIGGCYPDASTTGVPSGTSLTTYSGSCTITTPSTTIDSKIVNCNCLVIDTTGVTITNSQINGCVHTDEDSGNSFTITDSWINAPTDDNQHQHGLGTENYTATRVYITGSRRSAYCYHDCTIQDSYVTGQMTDPEGVAHESGIRMSQGLTLLHTSVHCSAPEVPPDAGCSADLTGYGDFEVVENNLIQDNLFVATESGGFCAYGGSTPSKPFPDANNVDFVGNVFQRGGNNLCGAFGPITDFDSGATGNSWTGNKWDDGTTLTP